MIGKDIIGELVLLIAAVLIFRSGWTLLDRYLGYDNVIVMLIIGLVLAILSYGCLIMKLNARLIKSRQAIRHTY